MFNKDLALIELQNGFSLNSQIQPLCLHRNLRKLIVSNPVSQSKKWLQIHFLAVRKTDLEVHTTFTLIGNCIFLFCQYFIYYACNKNCMYLMIFNLYFQCSKQKIIDSYQVLGKNIDHHLFHLGRGKVNPNVSSNVLNEAKVNMLPDLGRNHRSIYSLWMQIQFIYLKLKWLELKLTMK